MYKKVKISKLFDSPKGRGNGRDVDKGIQLRMTLIITPKKKKILFWGEITNRIQISILFSDRSVDVSKNTTKYRNVVFEF